MVKKSLHLWLLLFVCICINANAEEKLLYSTNFQNWDAVASSPTPTTVTKTTDFSLETLSFTIAEIQINPTSSGLDLTKFNWNLVTTGNALAAKTATPYIYTSALKSITKVVFNEGATSSGRGFIVWKKSNGDADWVSIYSTAANPSTGVQVTLNINESDVAIKFTNLNSANNAYLFDLWIYGDYTSTLPQQTLSTAANDVNAGTITRTPNSGAYDQNTVVSLTATKNFGYKLVKWVDGSGNTLSTDNPYSVTMDADKTINAVFESLSTYNYSVSVTGSQWGKVSLSPTPTNGKYESGTIVTMKVVPNAVTTFSYWDDNSTTSERTILVDADKAFTATFDEIPFIVGWNFKTQTPVTGRVGDFYAETANTGMMSVYKADATTTIGWLANPGSFSPLYPCARIWTDGTSFDTDRRFFMASFSTINYQNIQIKSMMGANYQAHTIQKLEYSIDGTNFTTLTTIDLTTAYNATWVDANATLPVEAENQAKVYIRWIADATSSKLGGTTEKDGTALTNVYVYADKVVVNDTEKPILLSTVPAVAATNASAKGSIILTFNEKVKAGTGECTLGSTVLTPVFGAKTATFAYEKLTYDTEYTFTVPTGALTDMSGNTFDGTTITFRTLIRPQPIARLYDAVVSLDGSGDYTTIQAAIDGAPAARALPWLIFIKDGKYTGHINIPSTKPFINLIGQSVEGVIISDNLLCGDAGDGVTPVYHVSLGATVVVNSANCYFENITFENSWRYQKQTGPQALAMYSNNDRIIFKNCDMRSYQDTYLTSTSNVTDRHYLLNCKIEGAVDFIYGGGDVFFDGCNIYCTRTSGGYIVAPSHKAATRYGYVFSNCIIDGNTGVTTYYGRPWQNSPKTVFINPVLKVNVYAIGWYYKMGAIPSIFADYGTTDANGNVVDLSSRISNYEYDVKDANGTVINTVTGTAKNALTDQEAAQYTMDNVLYRSNDNWDPRAITEATLEPTNLAIDGKIISWNSVNYAMCYVIIRNNVVIGFTTQTSYTDDSAVNGQTYTYVIKAASNNGNLSAASQNLVTQISNTTSIKSKTTIKPTVYSQNSTLFVQAVELGATIEVVNLTGLVVAQTKATASTTTFNLKSGNYVVRIQSINGVATIKTLVK